MITEINKSMEKGSWKGKCKLMTNNELKLRREKYFFYNSVLMNFNIGYFYEHLLCKLYITTFDF